MLLLFSIFLLHSLVTLTTGNMENQMIPEGGNGNEDQIIMTNSMSGGLEMGMGGVQGGDNGREMQNRRSILDMEKEDGMNRDYYGNQLPNKFKRKGKPPQRCDMNGCTWESLNCDLVYEGERLYCFFLNIQGKLYINNIPDTVISVELQHNSITLIDLKTFDSIRENLQVLHLHDNKLGNNDTHFHIGEFPNLKRLDVSNNSLTKVNLDLVQSMPLLEILYMHENPNLIKRPNLTNLNYLNDILFDICDDSNGCTSSSLGCSKGDGWINCKNKDINGMLNLNDDMTNITHLYLDDNNINHLSTRMFQNSKNIEYISLNNNNINYILSNLLDAMPKLRVLQLDGNKEELYNNDYYQCPINKFHRRKRKIGKKDVWVCETINQNDL